MSKLKKLLFLLTPLVLIINIDPLLSYFSQDDFFHLKQVLNKDIIDIPSFFLPYNELGYAFYRPLTRELYSFVMYNLFHLSPLPYHLINLAFIFLNGFLTYKIVRIMVGSQISASIAYIIYLFSSVHSIELYYLSSLHILVASSFIILGLLSYQKFLSTDVIKYYYLAIFLSILAMISHELGVVFIVIVALLELIRNITSPLEISASNLQIDKILKNLKKICIRLMPFMIILGIRLVFFFMVKSLPNEDAYKPVYSLKQSINVFSWYTIWSFCLPEALLDFVGPKFSINKNFLQWYGDYVKIAFPIFIYLVSAVGILVYQFRKYLFRDKNFYFFVLSYIIALLPFLFFPHHRFVYYLGFSTVWFSVIIGYILGLSWQRGCINRIQVGIFLILWLVISYNTTNFNKITHWSAKRAVAAKFLLEDIEKKYPNPGKSVVFYIYDDPNYPKISDIWGTSSKQAFYILSGADGLQLLYEDPTLKAYYEAINNKEFIKQEREIIQYKATFPY